MKLTLNTQEFDVHHSKFLKACRNLGQQLYKENAEKENRDNMEFAKFIDVDGKTYGVYFVLCYQSITITWTCRKNEKVIEETISAEQSACTGRIRPRR